MNPCRLPYVLEPVFCNILAGILAGNLPPAPTLPAAARPSLLHLECIHVAESIFNSSGAVIRANQLCHRSSLADLGGSRALTFVAQAPVSE